MALGYCYAVGRLTYKDAGVDIDAGDAVAAKAGQVARSTPGQARVVGGVGGFAALVRPDFSGMKDPLLVFSTDGVGTKLTLARSYGRLDTLGIDLVAMCSNDILCTGARGLAFLDYYATGALDPAEAGALLDGIGEGCRRAGVPLVGGETAELPGLYAQGDFDMAGFMSGVVDRDKVLGPHFVQPGDVLIGIQSAGVHSNGFSLVNRLIALRNLDLDRVYEGFDRPLGEVLLMPTAIYNQPVETVMDDGAVHAMAHITGGGIAGNLIRVLPAGMGARVRLDRIPESLLWPFIQGKDIEDQEMRRVFNLGVGMILIVDPQAADRIVERLGNAMKRHDFLDTLGVFLLGEVVQGEHVVEVL